MTVLSLTSIRRDGGTQPRDHISTEVARDYAEALADGADLPPVTVFYDGAEYWLADGFHRALAHELLEREAIDADVRQGDRREAILFSVGANAVHGYRRSNMDKRRSVVTLLNDAEWATWSDREIARRCAVSAPLVGQLRPKAVTVNSGSEPTRTYLDRHGNTSTMKVGPIGKPKPTLAPIGGHVPDQPPAPADQRPASGSCGLEEASWITGFAKKRLKQIAQAGEIPGVQTEGGRLYFDHEKLAEWMSPAPIAVAPVRGSRQLRTLLGEIRQGGSIEQAAIVSEIALPEARLHLEAEQAGEYADIEAIEPLWKVDGDTLAIRYPTDEEAAQLLGDDVGGANDNESLAPPGEQRIAITTTDWIDIDDRGVIPATTPEQCARIQFLLDLFRTFEAACSVDDALEAWALFRGVNISAETVSAAALWAADFASRFPAVDADRQVGVAAMLERIAADVVE